MLVPTHSRATTKRLEDLILIGVQGRDRVVDAEDVERAVLVCERKSLLVGQRIAVALGVIRDVAAGRLVAQPLRTLRSAAPERSATSCELTGPAPAIALYRPSFSPITISGALMSRPSYRRPMKASSLASSIPVAPM